MPIPLTALEALDREFPHIRAKLLELAAALDRIDRAVGEVETDPRLGRVQQALEVLSGGEPDRAERIQLVFSLAYNERWRETFGLAKTP